MEPAYMRLAGAAKEVHVSKVLVIGAGGVSSVCVHKMAFNPGIFSEIHLASRTLAKCDAIAESVKARCGVEVATYAIDAEDAPHYPLRIHWNRALQEYDPQNNPGAVTPEQIRAAFGDFLEDATALLIPEDDD